MKKIKYLLMIILIFFLETIPKKHLQMYWFHGCPNGGDYFGKWLLEKMGFIVHFSKKPEILVSGSSLGIINSFDSNPKIWGPGFHNYEDKIYINNLNNIYAVRGKLSFKKLNVTKKIALGDPGLLLSHFFKSRAKKDYDICIISHFIDYGIFKKRYGDKFNVINMGSNNIEKIANSISRCNFIFSSSLHGIIFSHSLGVPAIHLENKELVSKRNFKFKDYYSVLDIPYIKEDLKIVNFNTIIKNYSKDRFKYLPNKKLIKRIQKDLLLSFPFNNFKNKL